MNKVKYNLYVLIIGVCLSSTNIIAQEEGGFMLEEVAEAPPPVYFSNVEFGFIYNSEDSFKFGEYNGLEEEGFYADFNFDVSLLTPYDDDSTRYMEFYGTDVGLDSRSVYGEYGQQGRYSAYIDYDQIPHNRLDDALTPFVGAGSNNQTLPASFSPTATETTQLPLASTLRQVDVETQRYKAGGGFSWIPRENWQFRGNYHHEIKDGTETLASIFAQGGGGNLRSSILVIPVDYEFDEADVGVAYTTDKYQLDLSYHFSGFNNRDAATHWRNPFNEGGGGTGAMFNDPGLIENSGPDNTAHQVTLSGGYNFGLYASRLSGSLSFGKMLQDDNFFNYTVNPRFLPLATPLPRSSLDGEIQTIFANLNYTARPLPRLSVGARYTYDDRDNKTPRDVYSRVRNDADAQADPADPTDSNNRLPRPYSLERHLIELNGDYRLSRMAKLGVGYEFENIDRDFSERETTREHTGNVKLSLTPLGTTSGWIKYAYSRRDGDDDYISNQPFIDGHRPVQPVEFENDPLLRKWYLADRDKHELKGNVNYMPGDAVSLGLTGSVSHSDYDNSPLGLQKDDRGYTTLDLGFYPRENVDTYAFLTYERMERERNGYERTVDLTPDSIRDIGRFYFTDTIDDVYSIGTGINIHDLMGGKVDISADYIFSYADTEIKPVGGTTAQPLGPEVGQLSHLTTRTHSITITGDYRLRDDMKLRAAYLFEYFKTRDWALDSVYPDTLNNVLLLGNTDPNYAAHVGTLSFIYEF
jgi:MtrB/PioB family decaheme-associated outer membrane protein